MHLPERDAPFAALLLIEALVEGGVPLGERIDALQQRCGGAAAYDRLDLRLANMEARRRLEAKLAEAPPQRSRRLPRAGSGHHRWGKTATRPQPLADVALLRHRATPAALLRSPHGRSGERGVGLGP